MFLAGLIRAMEALLLKVSYNIIRIYKGVAKWLLFVSECLFWWSPSITLDNNNNAGRLYLVFMFYTLPHSSVGLTFVNLWLFQFLNIFTNLINNPLACQS